MWIRLSLVLLCLLLIVSASQAQSDLPYQLRVPTADEYLTVMPRLLEQIESDYFRNEDQPQAANFKEIVWTQLMDYGRPREEYSYQRISRIYLPYTNDRYLNSSLFSHTKELNTALIQAWLRENPLDLDDFDATTPLIIGPNTITVIPRDFNGDGQHEWILDVKQDVLYARKEVVIRSEDGRYELLETPLPWFGCCTAYWFVQSGLMEEVGFGDLNGDGLPEWILAAGGYGANQMSAGHLYVLQWQDGRLIDLAENFLIDYEAPAGGGRQPVFPYGVAVDLQDANADGKTNIVIRQHKYDNWRCTWTQTRVFGWQNDILSLLSHTRTDDQVKGCAWAAAEEAMWASDYATAIAWYERAQTLPFAEEFTSDFWEDYTNTVWEYAQLRLALAYALTHQDEKARETIYSLQNVGIRSDAGHQMSAVLWSNIGEAPADICQAAYGLWFGYIDAPLEYMESDAMQYSSLIPTEAILGYTREFYPIDNWPPLPMPEKAGCNITAYGRPLSTTRIDIYLDDLRAVRPSPTPYLPLPPINYPQSAPIAGFQVIRAFLEGNNTDFLILARFYLMQIQQGIATGDEDEARYLFATALRLNNRPDEAREQYVTIYENATRESWRQLAGFYLELIASK